MSRVFRVVSALGAGAALVWGLAKSLRKRGRSEDPKAPQWPPTPEQTRRSEPVVRPAEPAKAEAPKAEPAKAEPAKAEPPKAEAPKAPEVAPVAAEPVAEEPLVLKGVVIEDPARLVAYVNDTSEADLQEAGLKGKALALVLESRPFADARALGETAGIGRRTLQTLTNALD
ncbi:MAG: hypothetical protein R3F61_00885 [Myxococcota bacterium]